MSEKRKLKKKIRELRKVRMVQNRISLNYDCIFNEENRTYFNERRSEIGKELESLYAQLAELEEEEKTQEKEPRGFSLWRVKECT